MKHSWSSHTKRKANAKVTSLYWVHSIFSLPATPSKLTVVFHENSHTIVFNIAKNISN